MDPYLIETKAGYVDGQTEDIVCEDLQLLDQFSHRGVREVNIDEESDGKFDKQFSRLLVNINGRLGLPRVDSFRYRPGKHGTVIVEKVWALKAMRTVRSVSFQ